MAPSISNAHVEQLGNSAQVIRLIAAKQTDIAHRAALDLTAHTLNTIATTISKPKPAAAPSPAQTASSSTGGTVTAVAGTGAKATKPRNKRAAKNAAAKPPATAKPGATAATAAA